MNTYFDHFESQYRVYTGAFCGKPQLDDGGKIILPASALDQLAHLNIVYPMLFKVHNKSKNKYTYCGVLEFSAEEGFVYIPFWMQENLQLAPGQIVTITNSTLPKGTYCNIRPQQKAFIELSDPRAVLEKTLRNFSCLTKGDTIMINYNNTSYLLDILEVESARGKCEAISIVEADVRVDFERPLDMPPSPVDNDPPVEESFASDIIPNGPPSQQQQQQIEKQEQPGFKPFTGSGRRLDGKIIKGAPAASTASSAAAASTSSSSTGDGGGSTSAVSSSGTPMVPVFGKKRRKYGEPASGSTSATTAPSSSDKKDEKGFKPFQGTGRTLK